MKDSAKPIIFQKRGEESAIIYADIVCLLNGLIDFLLLWLTAGIRRQSVKFWRLGIASLLGGIYSMLYLWPAFSFIFTLVGKITISLLMVWIAFGFHHPLTYFRNLRVFYLICFLAGGGVMALHYALLGNVQTAGGVFLSDSNAGWGSPVSWLLVLIGFPLVWLYTKWSFRSLEERNTIGEFLVPIRIQIEENVMECMGLIDTGNQLRDPITRTPVIMVEYSQLKDYLPAVFKKMVTTKNWDHSLHQLPLEWMVKVRVIPFRVTRSSGEMMLAFKPDKIEIWKNNDWNNIGNVFIGIDDGHLSSDGTYQAIIHPSCLSMIA